MNRPDCAEMLPVVFHTYRRKDGNQLSFEDFLLPIGGKLFGENRWVELADLIPGDELEHHYASQFSKGFGAPAKPFWMELGALIIKERLQITNDELVKQIKENPCLQYLFGLECFHYQEPFNPSMMVHFRRSLPAAVVKDCNERIVRHAKQRSDEECQDGHDDSGDSGESA